MGCEVERRCEVKMAFKWRCEVKSSHKKISSSKYLKRLLTLYKPIPENGQTHSNNSLAKADELFEYV